MVKFQWVSHNECAITPDNFNDMHFCSCLEPHRDLLPLSLFQNKLMIGLKLLHSRAKGKGQNAFEIYHQQSY